MSNAPEEEDGYFKGASRCTRIGGFTVATIHELHTKLVNKEISAVELTNAVISHKAKVESEVHAYLSDSHELALASAKAVDEAIAKGEAISPLAGIPGANKDNICIKKINLLHVHLKCWNISFLHIMHPLLNDYMLITWLAR